MRITEAHNRMAMKCNDLETALGMIVSAVENKGRAPMLHQQIEAEHRREWPFLWVRIDKAIRLFKEINHVGK